MRLECPSIPLIWMQSEQRHLCWRSELDCPFQTHPSWAELPVRLPAAPPLHSQFPPLPPILACSPAAAERSPLASLPLLTPPHPLSISPPSLTCPHSPLLPTKLKTSLTLSYHFTDVSGVCWDASSTFQPSFTYRTIGSAGCRCSYVWCWYLMLMFMISGWFSS